MNRLLTLLVGTRVSELAPGDTCRLRRGSALIVVDDVTPSRHGDGTVVLDVCTPFDGRTAPVEVRVARKGSARVYDHTPGGGRGTV